MSLSKRLTAEALGSAFLLATVVGSGIMAKNLAGGNVALALLGNTIPTGAILVVLIHIFGPVSGAHFNPAVTFSFWIQGEIKSQEALLFGIVQILAGIIGVTIAHLMFDLSLVQVSTTLRTGLGQWTGEFVATFGLIAAIMGCVRFKPEAVAMTVGLYITAAYWFTSSTSFANPAVTIARSRSDTFAGIAPSHVLPFIGMQLLAALVATYVFTWLFKNKADD